MLNISIFLQKGKVHGKCDPATEHGLSKLASKQVAFDFVNYFRTNYILAGYTSILAALCAQSVLHQQGYPFGLLGGVFSSFVIAGRS